MKNTLKHSVHLMTVKNDTAGRATIDGLRLRMKDSKSALRVQLYGRGHRFGKGRIHVTKDFRPKPNTFGFDNSLQSHLPLNVASHIAIYLTSRKGKLSENEVNRA